MAFETLKRAAGRVLPLGLSPRGGRNARWQTARALYGQIIEAARQPVFYTAYGVPDTVEGRTDLLNLHAFLGMRRLRGGGEPARLFSQTLFDVMVRDLDDNLREMGVGHDKVGKKVRELAEGFFGRLGAYTEALDGGGGGNGALARALGRNVYEDEEAGFAPALARYARAADAQLSATAPETLMRGEIAFPAPEAFLEEADR